ncbi:MULTISPECIES: ABC transporter ATP-binding protein [Staphylococcus]|uniref:ABC transporter ATP-binding protein n=1 Tax=Staphylococcus TaxID=1279 RepID=UPI0021D083CB|nr:ABC transporter ATP-binding protein [Staphylococcus sp. IVB6181]UXV35213.1 ABC transporter ATP-binding protein [Staphylococcus sp. IVB6181]
MALEIRHLKKAFGTQSVIKGVDLDIAEGEFVALLGASGSGKTTLLRLIAGLEKADSGHIEQNGRVFFSNQDKNISLVPSRRNIGMVFQDFALWPHMTVFENVAYPLRVKKDTKGLKQCVNEVLKEVHLEGYGKRKIHELSGGQQQRVSLARAIVSKCELILMDEPLSALDAGLREDMRLLIQRLVKQYNMTAIFVTHDQYEAMTMSDRIAVMQNGTIEQFDTPENLYAHPNTEAVARFIGKGTFLKGTLSEQNMHIDQTALKLPVNHTQGTGRKGLLLRPEHIYRAQKGYEAVIATVSYTGERYEYTAYIEGVTVMFYDDAYFDEGDKVTLQFNISQHYLINLEEK